MIIPVGLIMRGLQEVEDEEFRALLRYEDRAHEIEMFEKRGRELFAACTGPDACLLVVGNADWTSLALDDVRPYAGQAPAFHRSSPYTESADPLGAPPHGFFAVCAGLHVLTQTVDGEHIGRAITMAPRKAYFLRVDPSNHAFVDCPPDDATSLLERLAGGTLSLFDYNATVAAFRMRHRLARSNHEAHLDALADLLEAFGCFSRGDHGKAWAYARRAQIVLTGAPIDSFSRMIKLATDHDARLRSAGRAVEARGWLDLVSWVVPGLPEIDAAKG